jgi:transcriptional regulator with XRE-family HTH domain
LRSLHTRHYKRFAEVLVRARERMGLTQREVATRLRKPASFVWKYEHRERRLDVPEFLMVARALGVSAARLLKEIEAALDGQ